MIKRLTRSSGVAALAACAITSVGYLFATRHPNRFQGAFQDNWAIIAAGLLLAVLGLLEMGRGLALGFSVLGAFQENNVPRGAGSLLAGAGISASGVALLFGVLFG
jgi:hypothetical protein